MAFEEDEMRLTASERQKSAVLVVEPDNQERHNLRNALKTLGYGTIGDASSHAAALERMSDRKFSHIVFDAKKTNMPPKEFCQKVFEIDSAIIAIPSSLEPNVDDVFELLILGAKGYVVKPFTVDALDRAIVQATKGEPIADAVLKAKDRNEALVAIMMSSLDKAATVLRQASQFETAKREIPRAVARLHRAAELAKTFAKDGDAGLLIAMETFCIERSKGPASKLGRLRKRLSNTRGDEENDQPSA
jgi:DNA-binding NarL/FixJ family response regulator